MIIAMYVRVEITDIEVSMSMSMSMSRPIKSNQIEIDDLHFD